MLRRSVSAAAISSVLAAQVPFPAAAQTRQALGQESTMPTQLTPPVPDAPTTKPAPIPDAPTPLPAPVPERPVTLPAPIPDRPTTKPMPPTYPTPLPSPQPGYGGYAGSLRCESRDGRTERCNVRTEGRVALVQQHKGSCTEGRTWGYGRRDIWVANNCRATFAYGYGDLYPQPVKNKDDGVSPALIIGGVAVAAGLVALLASKSKKKAQESTATTPATPAPPATFPPGPPAVLSADLSSLSSAQRPSMQTCLFEASRQVGATGGMRLKLGNVTNIVPGNGGWRFNADLVATYPDGDRDIGIYCRATPTKVVQLDFTA